MKSTPQQELEKLVSFINESHMGDYTAVSRDLYRTINYLHYLKPGTIGIVELHNTCFTLYRLAESFFEAHRLKEKTTYPVIEELEAPVTAADLWVYNL